MCKIANKILILFLAVIFILSGCTAQPENSDKIKIATTIFPEYDFARAVAGEKAEVTLLIPAGSDMHSFEPTALDIANINDSDLFIYNGGESDSWVDKIISNINTDKTKVLKMTDFVSLLEDDHHEYDEHIWTSPANAQKMIEAITQAICEIDKTNTDFYKMNSAEYIGKIKEKAELTQSVVSAAKHKKIVVADRFPLRYFTEYYGLEYVAAFGGCEHDTDADIATVTRLIEAVKQDDLSAVYHIELSAQNVAKTVADATDTKLLELHSAHNISSDDFKGGVTYIDIMERNMSALKKGLN